MRHTVQLLDYESWETKVECPVDAQVSVEKRLEQCFLLGIQRNTLADPCQQKLTSQLLMQNVCLEYGSSELLHGNGCVLVGNDDLAGLR